MENLKIPGHYQAGIKELHALSEGEASELLVILTSEAPTLRGKDLVSCLQTRVNEVSDEAVEQIVGTLLALDSFRSFLDVSVAEFVDAIGKSENFAELEIPTAQNESLKQRLASFLSARTLAVTAKAMSVLTAHEHVLDNARILTDVRSVFDDDEDLTGAEQVLPAAAVIVHMLALRCQNNGDLEEYFIALDTNDIRKLQLILERANNKAKSLQNMLKNAGVPYLEVVEEAR